MRQNNHPVVPELKKDPISGRWVIIARQRAKRPHQLGEAAHAAARPEPCPFCPGNEALTPPEVLAYRNRDSQANAPGWTVRVVPNKYPALADAGEKASARDPIYQSRHAVGVHEVIIESPQHVASMAALSAEQITLVLRAYRERIREIKKNPRWRYTLIYKNQGQGAGATLEHVHSQLIALPAPPAQAQAELDRAGRYYDATRRCIYCDLLEREKGATARLILDADRFIVFCPYAPRFAYETWILPTEHIASFEQVSDHALSHLASVIKDLTARLNRALDDPPFNYLIQSIRSRAGAPCHWRIEFLPQIARAAGFEWGTGIHVNGVAPEDAARLLRAAV